MSGETRVEQLAELFKETGGAHHQAFIETDGQDPDWPLWYANYLHDRLIPFLAAPITRSRLIFCLVEMDDEHRATDPDAPWPQYYARRTLECLGPAPVKVDEIIRSCHLSAPAVSAALLELELAGRLERHPGQQVSLIRASKP